MFKKRVARFLRNAARSIEKTDSQGSNGSTSFAARRRGQFGDMDRFESFRDGQEREWSLFSSYRNHIKGRWHGYFWPTRVLFELHRRGALPAELEPLRERIQGSCTLPLAPDEIAEELERTLGAANELIHRTGTKVAYTAQEVFVVVPADVELRELHRTWLKTATSIVRGIWGPDQSFSQMRALEIGTGRGYFCYALAALGFDQAVGIDVDPAFYPMCVEQPRVVETFCRTHPGIDRRVQIGYGDCHGLEYADATFDFIASNSVLEHIEDLPHAMRELARVLKQGGIAWHSVGPWCAPDGGHSLCTLDFPWGHVVLEPQDFEAYVRRFRIYESDEAIQFYHNGFQSPRLTLAEFERAVLDAGFEILEWIEERHRHVDHYAWVDGELLAACRARHPEVTVRDLMTGGLRVTLRRR